MKKITGCKRVFQDVYIRPNGEVTLCSWNHLPIGNLLDNTLHEIWHSQRANEIRDAIIHGDLTGCNEMTCPHCINRDSWVTLSSEELRDMYDHMPDNPIELCFAHDERCNHICPSCRKELFKPDAKYLENLKTIVRNVEPYLTNAIIMDMNGGGELFVSQELVDMLSRFHPSTPDFYFRLESNGVLFKVNWDKVSHLGQYMNVAITPNSYDRETYHYLAGKDDLFQLEENLEFVADLRRNGKIKMLEITMVVQDSNFRQIPSFIEQSLERFNADQVILRPIFQWFCLNEDEHLYKNVLNPCHPYHKNYLEVIKNPICSDPRVYNWGFLENQPPVLFPTLAMKRSYEGMKEFSDKICSCLETVRPALKKHVQTNQNAQIILFGPGKVGRIVFEQLSCGKNVLPIRGFMVSHEVPEPEYYMGCPIRDIAGYSDTKETDIVLISLTRANQIGVKEALQSAGYRHVIAIDAFSDGCLS